MNLKVLLTVLFGTSVVVANVTAAKLAWFDLPLIGGVSVPAGFVAFGFAFLCSDLLVEYEGREYAHDVVNATVASLVVGWALIYAAIALPVAPFYEAHDAYATTLGASANIVLASVVTLLASQHLDVAIFASIRERTGAAHRWARNLLSTSTSQFVDTVLFITLGFALLPLVFGGDVMWGRALVSTIVGQYVVKVVVAILDTPVFYAVTSLVNPEDGESERGDDEVGVETDARV
ncbi:queuosine precursor transporter [Natrialbaceae archaeon GCM10025810]|uniref:queuosine precursor transporter n=1 Tax=Halovalidus salilacus TaxID=3075124 RepID=UPI00361AD744